MTDERTPTDKNFADLQNDLAYFLQRSSARHFKHQQIPQQIIDVLLQCALQAPTSSHEQAFAIINVSAPALRTALASLCDNQQWIVTASHFFVICADLYKISAWTGFPVDEMNPDVKLAAIIDAALVGMTLSLSAEAIGLGGVMIGAVRNNVPDIVKLLQLPKGVFPLFGLCLGYYERRKKPKLRLPKETLVFKDTYQLPSTNESCLKDYHEKLTQYYEASSLEHETFRARARQGTWLDWCKVVTTAKYREQIKQHLKQQGFEL
jgi:nitroreductase